MRDNGDPLPFDPRTVEVGFEQRVQRLPGTPDLVNHLRRKVVQRDGTFSIESPAGLPSCRSHNSPRIGPSRPSASRVRHHRSGDRLRRWRVSASRDCPDRSGEWRRRARHRSEQSRCLEPHRRRLSREYKPLESAVAVRSIGAAPPGRLVSNRGLAAGRLSRGGGRTPLPRNAWSDPAVLERLWPLATRFRLREGERRTIQLKLSATPNGLLD